MVVQWSAHPIRYVLFILSLGLNSLSLSLLKTRRSQVHFLCFPLLIVNVPFTLLFAFYFTHYTCDLIQYAS